jgi:hypothetical protein
MLLEKRKVELTSDSPSPRTPYHTQPINLATRQSVGLYASDAPGRSWTVALQPNLAGSEDSRALQSRRRRRRTGASSPLPVGELDQSLAGGSLSQWNPRLYCNPLRQIERKDRALC